ncbi:unnamed protein product [Phytophthora fragariaefolia]|uniref:Unnamed protein product n=1 Tax=Phytophthora fragariaefolia TaxID=1490495 RepID=A0A9W6XN60_9STRA|nr:unnamed protein product [Phytophthora fragariaefolia]
MKSDASGDEYEDDLEAEEEVELDMEGKVVPDAAEGLAYNPGDTAVDSTKINEVADNRVDVFGSEGNTREEVGVGAGESTISAEGDSDGSSEENVVSAEDKHAGAHKREVGRTIDEVIASEQQEEVEFERPIPRHDAQQNPRRGPKNRPSQAEAKDLQIAALSKKLNQARKLNAELHCQLQRFYTNDAVIQDNFPNKRRALQEELRVCKERIKQLKEQYRAADEKGFKLHQQSFDLTVKNKGLSEKVRLLEGVTASTSLLSTASSSARIGAAMPVDGTSPEEVQTIIASQEEEITRLHQRVALMKKTHKADQAKYERLLKASQDEIDQARTEMEEFYQQLFAKERAARTQFLHMKKLKRALHELANTQQTNQRFQPFLANREMRLTNRSNGSHHNQLAQSSPHKGPVSNPGRWIHEALHHLGFVMPLSSELDGSARGEAPEDRVDIPENCIQGKLLPFPPPTTVDRGFPAISTRPQFHNSFGRQRGSRASNNGDLGDVSEQATTDCSDEEALDAAVTPVDPKETWPHTPLSPGVTLYWEDIQET